jgi:integrase
LYELLRLSNPETQGNKRLVNTSLTNIEAVAYLLNQESEDMQGVIRPTPRQRNCPKCGKPFQIIKRLGFACAGCQTIPRRFVIDIRFSGQRYFIYSDKQGKALDSFARAQFTHKQINDEIEDRTFDPTKYIKSDIEQFYVSNLIERFLSHKLESLAPSYIKDYRRMVAKAKEHFGSKDVREIRKLDIVKYHDALKAEGYTGKTLKNILDLFKTFLYWCKTDLEIISNVPVFPDIDIQINQIQWVDQEDQINLFRLVPDADKPFVAFLMLHGVRPGEARALRCKQVDLKKQIITISATFSGNVYREKRKGRRSRALIIPIHPEIFEYMSEKVRNNLPEAYLFVNHRNGLPYSENKVRRIWDAVRTAAGLPASLRLYDVTRHSFASNLVNSGTSLYLVSKLLGHSSTKMTEKYAHPDLESMKVNLQKISLHSVQPVYNKVLPLKNTN